MPRGPLPKPNPARRNAPTIPTTDLPAGGRKGRIPNPPVWIDLGMAGVAWWRWAWKTPQSAAWSDGDMCVIARRASLEDDMRVMCDVDTLDFFDALNEEEEQHVKALINRLAGLATGKVQVCREMRELDNQLGLTPKGMAALRWKIVGDAPATEKPKAVKERRGVLLEMPRAASE